MRFDSYAPIASFYVSDNFADVPFPLPSNWEAATGEVMVGSFIPDAGARGGGGKPRAPGDLYTKQNFAKFSRPWHEKMATAFFRGGGTGGGFRQPCTRGSGLAQRCTLLVPLLGR